MDMTYRVSKNAYIELLADMVRRNDSRPIKLLTTFLLTLGQMAAVTQNHAAHIAYAGAIYEHLARGNGTS